MRAAIRDDCLPDQPSSLSQHEHQSPVDTLIRKLITPPKLNTESVRLLTCGTTHNKSRSAAKPPYQGPRVAVAQDWRRATKRDNQMYS